MLRQAFFMRLKPGSLAEYKRHHDNIWPELVTELRRCGIRAITIFEDEPNLVLFSEIEDEGAWSRIWATDVHDRWGKLMNQYLEFNAEGKVDAKFLREIWHLET